MERNKVVEFEVFEGILWCLLEIIWGLFNIFFFPKFGLFKDFWREGREGGWLLEDLFKIPRDSWMILGRSWRVLDISWGYWEVDKDFKSKKKKIYRLEFFWNVASLLRFFDIFFLRDSWRFLKDSLELFRNVAPLAMVEPPPAFPPIHQRLAISLSLSLFLFLFYTLYTWNKENVSGNHEQEWAINMMPNWKQKNRILSKSRRDCTAMTCNRWSVDICRSAASRLQLTSRYACATE